MGWSLKQTPISLFKRNKNFVFFSVEYSKMTPLANKIGRRRKIYLNFLVNKKERES